MWRRLANFASIVVLVGLLSPLAVAQTYRYDFDGLADEDPQPADPTDWMTPENWGEDGFDPLAPAPLLPDFDTRVEIDNEHYGVNAPVIGPGDMAEAYGVRIARSNGPGLLTMTGGTLDLVDRCSVAPFNCDSRLRVGAADVLDPLERHPGTFDLSGGTVTTDTLWIGSGSHGEMNMSDGMVNTRGNFYFDWTSSDGTYDAYSVLNMTGGTIHVGTSPPFNIAGKFRMYRLSSLNLDGGEILVDGSAELGSDNFGSNLYPETPDVTVSITAGLLESKDFLQIGGSITLDGGILRAASFNDTDSAGTVEVNTGGLLQFENSLESVAAVEGYITSGFFTTSEASPLTVQIVDVGGTDFTQVSIAALGLLGDYNENDEIDAADYTAWRDVMTAGGTALANDPTPGIVDETDFAYWRDHFGEVLGSGSGALAGAGAAVPEPASFVYGLIALAAAILLRRPT